MSRHIGKLKLKAPGHDGVINPLIVNGGEKLHDELRWIFTLSLNTGYLPESWKFAVVTPVPKEGKPQTSAEGYRPISLLPAIAKIMEAIIAEYLLGFFEDHGLLPDNQNGFRGGRCTTDAIVRLVHDVAVGLYRDNGFRKIKRDNKILLSLLFWLKTTL